MHIKFMYLVLHGEQPDNAHFAHCFAQPGVEAPLRSLIVFSEQPLSARHAR
jgi:hypothetical protein